MAQQNIMKNKLATFSNLAMLKKQSHEWAAYVIKAQCIEKTK